ncbi:aspartate/glutamate racemase family protein [Microbacterium sp. NPDC096154]|uniref:aspartate/glutamate racemase family protein n=1 Tax=Microbacterium sp. NPDC096154 TaxID=3155549 RepID=UPI00331B2973
MKRIGLLGGMSWESSALYYRLLNTGVRDALGGLHSASCVMGSVDFAEIERLQSAARWDEAGEVLAREARALVAAGAEALVLCTNTMHLVAEHIERAVDVPLLHIVDVTAEAILAAGKRRVALLGTIFTMEQPFYADRMARHGVETLVPAPGERQDINRVIYDELVRGVVSDDSRKRYIEIVERLAAEGAEGVILGCTEIELLIGADDVSIPVYPTTALHAQAAVAFALGR